MRRMTFCLPVSIVVSSLFLFGCSTSTKAIEQGNYRSAIHLAFKEYTKEPQNRQAKQNLLIAADSISQRALANAILYEDEKIKVWKSKRSSLYNALELLGKYNIDTDGLVSESYDAMCDAKYTIDISIVDYYYQYGLELLNESITSGNKELAREAYAEFEESDKQEARLFYNDIDSLYASCIEYGSILVDLPYGVETNNIFLIALDDESPKKPDCTVKTHRDQVLVDVVRSYDTKKLSKTVVTGQEEIRDTSGVVYRWKDIKEKVYAYKNTEEVEFSAHANVYVNVQKNTEDCFIDGYTKSFSEDDDCENITYSGDMRARQFEHDENCNESTIRNKLIREVENDLNQTLWIY